MGKYLVTKENTLKIVGAFAAGFGVYLAVVGISMESWIKYTLVVVAAIVGFFILRGNEVMIISFSTAFLGSVMMMHGVGCYLGGFPSLSHIETIKNQKLTMEFAGYLGGIVIFTIGGGFFQKKNAPESGSYMSDP